LGDLIEGTPVTVQESLFSRVFLESSDDAIGVFRVDLYQARLAIATLTRDQRAAGTAEQIRHNVAGFAAVQQSTLNQLDRLRRGMNPVGRGLFLLPKR